MMDGNCDFLFQTALKQKSLTVQAVHQAYKGAQLVGFSQDPPTFSLFFVGKLILIDGVIVRCFGDIL